MQVPRAYHSATTLKDGRVLVAGGCTAYVERICSRATGSAELHNPSDGTWSKTRSMKLPRFGHAATLLPGGKVLVVGGCTRQILGDVNEKVGRSQCDKGATAEAEIYDAESGKWSKIAKMSRRRTSPMALLLPGKAAKGCGQNCGHVLVVGDPPPGGPEPFEVTPPAELYDVEKGAWNQAGATPAGLQPHLQNGVVLGDGTVLFAGPSSWVYGPGDQSWRPTVQPQPIPHMFSSASLLEDGRVLLLGAASAELYDPFTAPDPARPGDKGAWKPLPAPASKRTVHATVRLDNGKVLLLGGGVNARPVTSTPEAGRSETPSLRRVWSGELFDPSATRWSPTGRMVVGHADPLWETRSRPEFSSSLLEDGRVLIAGGAASVSSTKQPSLPDQKALNAAQIYTPETYVSASSPPAAAETNTPLIAGCVLAFLLAAGLLLRFKTRPE